MKKNVRKVALAAIVAACAGYGVYTSQETEKMSDLMLENLEALAGGESFGKFFPIFTTESQELIDYGTFVVCISRGYMRCMPGGTEDCSEGPSEIRSVIWR